MIWLNKVSLTSGKSLIKQSIFKNISCYIAFKKGSISLKNTIVPLFADVVCRTMTYLIIKRKKNVSLK